MAEALARGPPKTRSISLRYLAVRRPIPIDLPISLHSAFRREISLMGRNVSYLCPAIVRYQACLLEAETSHRPREKVDRNHDDPH